MNCLGPLNAAAANQSALILTQVLSTPTSALLGQQASSAAARNTKPGSRVSSRGGGR